MIAIYEVICANPSRSADRGTAACLLRRKYLQLKRIEAVRRRLTTTHRSIEQILEHVGVSDATSFRRIFQRELGCSPAEFRRTLARWPS